MESNSSKASLNLTATLASTSLRFDYIVFIRRVSWMRFFFAAIYLSSNLASATCLALLLRFYFSKKYHKVYEKNLNSVCLSLLTTNVLKGANFFRKSAYLEETLVHINLIATFLFVIAAADLYLTSKCIVKDVFVEEAANRRRFLLYSICGWLLPILVVRAVRDGGRNIFMATLREYFGPGFAITLMQTHCLINFVSVVIIWAAYPAATPTRRTGNIACTIGVNTDLEAFEGYKHYSDEEYTCDIVRFLSSVRFVFHLLFLVSRASVVLSILDFFRAYEGMYIYYYLVVERRKKWSCSRSLGEQTVNVANTSAIYHVSVSA